MNWHPRCISSGSSRLGTVSLPTSLRRRVTTTESDSRILTGHGKSSIGTWREKELKRVDIELAKGNHKAALKIVKRMQGKPGGLRGFGAANQVPFAKSSSDQLDVDGVDISCVQPMVDSMLELIIKTIQSAFEEEPPSGLNSFTPGVENIAPWELHLRSKQHEAGHFIVAYLLGVLPRTYEVPSIKAIKAKSTKGHVHMVDFASPLELNRVKSSSKNLNKFSCIALGGLVAAYLEYGYTGGFVSDVDKLYITLNWLEFTESKAESYLKWAILNTSQMLRRHRVATLRLADAMALGRSIGYCIGTIEDSLSDQEQFQNLQ